MIKIDTSYCYNSEVSFKTGFEKHLNFEKTGLETINFEFQFFYEKYHGIHISKVRILYCRIENKIQYTKCAFYIVLICILMNISLLRMVFDIKF